MISKLLQRSITISKFNFAQEKRTIVLFPGDGIGPEIAQSVKDIFKSLSLPIEFEEHFCGKEALNADGDLITQDTLNRVRELEFALKGPLMTPIGKGFKSQNVTLRKKLKLYANVRPCKTFKGIDTPYSNTGVDLVTIRENTEGEYSGLEHIVAPGIVANLKIISELACQNIARYAYKFARDNNRKNIVIGHKADVMKRGDGLFLRICQEVAKEYPEVNTTDIQINTLSLKLAENPQKFDIMVMPNLYGDIISDLCAGLIGGLGLTASGNIGEGCEVYEAVHGTAPDIAGKNLANPTALILSSVMMLNSMGYRTEAQKIQTSIQEIFEQGKYITGDLGGKSSCSQFTKAIIENIK